MQIVEAQGDYVWTAKDNQLELREDHSQLRLGHAPQLLAILNNIVVGLVARQGRTNLAEARREFADQLERAFAA